MFFLCHCPHCCHCPNRARLPEWRTTRSHAGRQGRLLRDGNCCADTINPAHLHCFSGRHGWSDRYGADASSGLAVFHYGYDTLKRREVQFHGTAQIPTDAAAMLDWGLDTPFMSQDRAPLAIAMTATVDGIQGRRYRLVIAQKAKLRLSPEVATALASRAADHRLTASGFFPCSIDREFL